MKKITITTLLVTLFAAGTAYAQLIGSLNNYSLNPNGHDIIRDIGATEDNVKVTVGSYQPTTNAPYDGFIWSDHFNNSYDWLVTVHGSGNDEINACDIRKMWNGSENVEEIYVTGYFTGTVTFTRTTWGPPYGYVLDFFTMNSPYGSNDCTYFVAKFNRLGGLMWIQYSGNTTQANTEIGNDVDVCVVGSEVQVYTTGFFRGSPYFYNGSTPSIQVSAATSWNAAFTTKYVDNGSSSTLSWVRTVNDNSNNQHDYGYGVCGDGAGNVYMCGSIGGTTTINVTHAVEGNDDALAMKYDASGTPDWVLDFGGNGTIQTPSDQARCITFANDCCFVSGYFNGTGGLMYTGSANSIDAFLFKLTADNGLPVKRNILKNTTGSDAGYKHCHATDYSKVYFVGHMTGDLSIYCHSLTAQGPIVSPSLGVVANGFIASFQHSDLSLIDYEWVGSYEYTSAMTTVEAFSDCKAHFGGVFKDYGLYESEDNFMAFNSNTNPSVQYNDGFYGHYDCDNLFNLAPASVNETTTGEASAMQLSVFPNPVNNILTITKSSDASAIIEVFDVSGRSVIEQLQMKSMQTTIDLTQLEAGIYIVRVTEGSNSESLRITKQ